MHQPSGSSSSSHLQGGQSIEIWLGCALQNGCHVMSSPALLAAEAALPVDVLHHGPVVSRFTSGNRAGVEDSSA
jgi:hypothetical protein